MSLQAAYALADALMMPVELKKGLLYGETRKDVKFGPMSVGFPVKIVSSMVIDNDLVVICRVMGDLGIAIMVVNLDQVTVMILDLTRMKEADNLIEGGAFQSLNEVLKELSPAVVAAYNRKGKSKYKKVV
jgi:hypothetical protein